MGTDLGGDVYHSEPMGRIEVVCGSMFSGKTEELIRRVRRAQIAKQKVQVFKPAIDDRFGIEKITSHNGLYVEARPVSSAEEIPGLVQADTQVIAVDEV
jgi:thymidine kinase